MTLTRHTRWTAAAALVAAVLAGVLTWVVTSPAAPLSSDQARERLRATESSAPSAARPSTTITPLITSTVGSAPQPSAVEPPTTVTLGSLGMTLPVKPVGIAADGQMDLPPNPAEVGWYRFGPSPTSDEGAVVLAAHVDSRRYGPGPLARAAALAPGSTIVVATGTRSVTYTVIDVISVQKTNLDLALIFDRTGPPRLHLITCGGEYVKGQGWTSNVTVIASRNG
ncbi:MAG: class F sortase [Propionibacteriaceae bacterium]